MKTVLQTKKRKSGFYHIKRTVVFIIGVCGSLFIATPAFADDTDIYLAPRVAAGGEPMVMLMLDWRPNLASTACQGGECASLISEGYLPSSGPYTFFDVIRASLEKVLEPLEGLQVGLMINHANTNNCAGPEQSQCSNGGFVVYGLHSMLAGDANGAKAALNAKLASIPLPQGMASHKYQGKELYFELFRYLTGQDVYNGHNGWVDFGTNDDENIDTEVGSVGWDTSIEQGNRYQSPLDGATQCTKLFALNFMFQVSQQEDDSDAAIVADRATGGMGGINLSGNNNSFDTVIEYLGDTDLADGSYNQNVNVDGQQNLISYFLVDAEHRNTTTNGYASAGGTGNALLLSENPDELVATLNSVFQSVLSVSTTFVAPSVPVNVFNRAETADEVFMALFKADENRLPRWPGNLKKLRIVEYPLTGRRELQDANGLNAIGIDGQIKPEALTLWTDSASLGTPINDDALAGTDGRAVQRGGAGQNIPGFAGGSPGLNNGDGWRQIYGVDPSAAGGALLDLDATDSVADLKWAHLTSKWSPQASAGTFAGATSAERTRARGILNFVRGYETDGSTARSWMMGDPLHSRPRAINYGSRASGFGSSNPDIRILVGSNDGYMRMIRNTDGNGNQDGSERWAFVPDESLAVMARLEDNLAGNPVHPVSVDGSAELYIEDVGGDGNLVEADGDKAYAYFGLRRGGKAYYALDISDPDSPRFLWKITKGAADSDFGELGQSWSTPQIGRVRVGTAVIPVAIFGGGYNGDDDGDNVGDLGKDAANRATTRATGTDDDEGNAIYVVNAVNGNLIWKANYGSSEGYDSSTQAYHHPGMVDSFAADVAVLDTNGDRLLDRVYAGDTGGTVWRIDLAGGLDSNGDSVPDTVVHGDPSLWQVNRFANVGRHADSGVQNDRRFFIRPDVTQTLDDSGAFDAVLIGTGDREDPNGVEVDNWFFEFKDRGITSGLPNVSAYPLTLGDLGDVSDACVADQTCSVAPNLAHGWKLSLSGLGEKNLATAVTSSGFVIFTTFEPTPPTATCGLSEGRGNLYAVSLADASPVFNFNVTNDTAHTIVLDRSTVLASGGIPVEAVVLRANLLLVQGMSGGNNILQIPGPSTFKTYWREY
jgi:type IV pilus assembly protein PilY1